MAAFKHTFVIPVYKDSIYLEDCIRSLKDQTIPSAILIITSTPSDFIVRIAEKYNIEIRINRGSGGIAGDWNFAYKNCPTKYLTLAHQDDVYLPDYAETCLGQVEKKKHADTLLVFTDYREIVNSKESRYSKLIMIKKFLLFPFLIRNNYASHLIKKSILSFGNAISCPTVMFNKDNIGLFEFSDQFRYNLDWEAWLRLAEREGKFIFINRKLVLHRMHNESQTAVQIMDNNRLKEEEKIFTMIWNKPIARVLMFFYRYGSKLNVQSMD